MSLLKKFRTSIDSDKREVSRKVSSYRDPEIRRALAILGRASKTASLSCWYGDPVVTIDLSGLEAALPQDQIDRLLKNLGR